ncbi:MAG: HNH endonuclease [Mycolicibacterium aromaticivorans]|nr:HNH endonuclease [Mycolicibacterium aromaticivorans]
MLSIEVDEALDAIDAALTTLAKVDLAGLAVMDVLELAARCEKAHRQNNVVRYDLSHELHRRDVSEVGGKPGRVLADWLRITPAEAKRRAEVADPLTPRRALSGEPLSPRHPGTAQAWRDGTLDGEHVRVIQKFLGGLPFDVPEQVREGAEVFLAEHAVRMRPDQLSRVAHRLALEINPDGVFSDEDRARKRSVVMGRQQPDGMTEIRIQATPEMRSYVEAVFAKYAALGMCNLGDPTLGQHNGLPVTVIVSTTLQELQSKSGHGVTGGGSMVPIVDVIRMARHAYHYLTIFDGVTGQALWLGRTKRIASADQRIVLHGRDRGCTKPGCTVPGYASQVHHAVKDWKDGGNTNVDELSFACPPDNQLVETGGWTTRKLPNGDTEWIPPPHLPMLIGGVNDYHHPERFLEKRGDP